MVKFRFKSYAGTKKPRKRGIGMLLRRFRVGTPVVLLALFVALSLTAFGCGTQVQKPKDFYKIGGVLSTSGPAAPLGQPEQRSLMLFEEQINAKGCLLYTSDAADDLLCVDLGGRRIIKKKTK